MPNISTEYVVQSVYLFFFRNVRLCSIISAKFNTKVFSWPWVIHCTLQLVRTHLPYNYKTMDSDSPMPNKKQCNNMLYDTLTLLEQDMSPHFATSRAQSRARNVIIALHKAQNCDAHLNGDDSPIYDINADLRANVGGGAAYDRIINGLRPGDGSSITYEQHNADTAEANYAILRQYARTRRVLISSLPIHWQFAHFIRTSHVAPIEWFFSW